MSRPTLPTPAAAQVGRVFQHHYEYAWFVATVATVTMVLMLLVAMLLVGACLEMEHPLGGDAMDCNFTWGHQTLDSCASV